MHRERGGMCSSQIIEWFDGGISTGLRMRAGLAFPKWKVFEGLCIFETYLMIERSPC